MKEMTCTRDAASQPPVTFTGNSSNQLLKPAHSSMASCYCDRANPMVHLGASPSPATGKSGDLLVSPAADTDGLVQQRSRPQSLLLMKGWRRRSTVTVGFLAICAIAVGIFRWVGHARAWTRTDNAYAAARVHLISSRVAGTISEVLVDENQAVTAGTVLARLDPRDFEIRRQQAAAQLTQSRAEIEKARAQVAQARAQIVREQAQATKAEQDYARAKALYQGAGGAISKQEFDEARAASDATRAALDGAQSALEFALSQEASARAQEKVAESNLEDAELQLGYTELRAPSSGRVAKRSMETGNRIQPGQSLLALVEPEIWVLANFKETQLAEMRPGQMAEVRFDALPGHRFLGQVEGLSPGTGAQFALLPPENATGNFTRIVQRVPVKIVLDQATLSGYADRLVAGLSGIVEVKVRP